MLSALSVVVNAQADALDMRWSSGLIAGWRPEKRLK